jgi:NAD(P)-dependent dehydrogenase (short-subunit alcohol dehydrogenase family)
MNKSLQGKVAVVTGAASGMGRAAAMAFAREGAKVVVADIATKGGEETVSLIRKAGGEAFFCKTDVTKASEVESMVNTAVEKFGRLDCAFNNSGIGGTEPSIIADTEESFDRIMDVNLKGVWLCMKYEITFMASHDGGAIVNNASTAGHVGNTGCSIPYVASKHGVIGLTRAATMIYSRAGIRINAVCPGATRTPMFDRSARFNDMDPALADANFAIEIPVGRLGTPEDVAEAVVWLCSDAAAYVAGHALTVDGGWLAGHYKKT